MKASHGLEVGVTGSVAFDHIMNFPGSFKDHILPDKIHCLNVSFLVHNLTRIRGGCAANIAYAMALHGLRPRLVAAVGSDFADYRTWLEAHGVETAGARVFPDLLTASCFITTDKDNNQITGFYPGAMGRARELALEILPGKRPAFATISPNDPEAMTRYPAECRRLGIPFLFDPGQQVIALDGRQLEDGLRGAKVAVLNDYEWSVVSEKTGRTGRDVLELAEAVVVTLGADGSRIHARGEDAIHVKPVKPREVVDPTGCGDAYRGGLVRGILAGLDWKTCGQLGSLTGTFCIEAKGPTGYHFTRESFAARFESAFGAVAPAVPA
jgi:adenosine kinase